MSATDRSDEPISPGDWEGTEGLGDWRLLGDGASAFYRLGSLAEAARFVGAIAELPEIDRHPPGIDVRRDGVTVRIATMTTEHFGASGATSSGRGRSRRSRDGWACGPTPPRSSRSSSSPEHPTRPPVMPFWQAVLGYERRPDSPDEDLVDPHDRGAMFWFERMEEPRSDGGGSIHIAVWVPYEQAEARIAAALAAGGRIVRDTFAPAGWTLADPAGNEADIATAKGRG